MNGRVADAAPPLAGQEDGLAQWIAPGRTAVVVIDIQVDFASPDGVLGKAGVDMGVVQPAVAGAERLVASARKAGTPVIFVGLQTSAALDSQAWRERMRRQGADPNAESAVCRAGEQGAAFVGPQPAPGELVIPKIRYSSFYGTNLKAGLDALGVDTLVVCGLTTECCVDCTVRDAFHLDYHVFIATDATGAYDLASHEGALKNLELNCAILATVDEIDSAWNTAAAHG